MTDDGDDRWGSEEDRPMTFILKWKRGAPPLLVADDDLQVQEGQASLDAPAQPSMPTDTTNP